MKKSTAAQSWFSHAILPALSVAALLTAGVLSYKTYISLTGQVASLKSKETKNLQQLASIQKELTELKGQDQYVINKKLEADSKQIEVTYDKAVTAYEKLLDLKGITTKTAPFDELFTKALSQLSQRDYISASATLTDLSGKIDAEQAKVAATFAIAPSIPQANAPPGNGYRRQAVQSDVGTFQVDLIAGELGSTRVIVDTASDGDCKDNCPVLSLADYVSRSGAYAGINGSYLCPADYPSCAGKKNSFDTLLMNKNKKYFNSDNNVYSTVPAAIFGNNWARFVGRSLDWGRDTSVDGVIANQPLLVSGGNVAFGGDGDPKKGSKGGRSFVANKGSTVYIGVVFNATVAEAAHILKTLGMDNGLNLDSGGSTALWSGGYRVGPGRNIPNAILFVRK